LISTHEIYCCVSFFNVPVYANIGKGTEKFDQRGISLVAIDPASLVRMDDARKFEIIGREFFPLAKGSVKL
jgi:hypothetical protein